MALNVNVTISLSKPAGKTGTWFPLIYVPVEDNAEAVYNECSNLENVVAAGYADGTEAYAVASLIFAQDNAPAKIAILKGSTEVKTVLPTYLNKNWRQLIVLGEYDAGLATYIETTEKMYFTHFATIETLKAAYEATSNPLKGFDRTFSVYYTDTTVKYPEAAVVGATAGLNAGSISYICKKIKGVAALDISDEDIEKAHSYGAITIVEKAGDIVTSEGIVGSGEYADTIDGNDYIIQKIRYNVQKAFNNNDKIPYTDAGISIIEAATLEALVDGYNNGIIAENEDGTPAYATSFAMRKDTTESDRASRQYNYGNFEYALSGAIHYAKITGVVTY